MRQITRTLLLAAAAATLPAVGGLTAQSLLADVNAGTVPGTSLPSVLGRIGNTV